MVKPSRSDPSDDDEGIQAWQHQIHEAIASGVANPKQLQRAFYCKPSRSEPDEAYYLSPTASPSERQMWRHQELLRCPEQQHLETITTTSVEAAEEYTGSDYYEGVRAVNKKHHHTTGTGLIKVSESGGFDYLTRPEMAVSNAPVKGKSNPAMNDWVPAEENGGHGKVSSKPYRGESNAELN